MYYKRFMNPEDHYTSILWYTIGIYGLFHMAIVNFAENSLM